MPSIEGCTAVGVPTKLYNLDLLDKIANEKYGEYPVTNGSGLYIDEGGKSWGCFKYLCEVTGKSRFHLENTLIPKLNLEPITVVFEGKIAKAYPVQEIIEAVGDIDLPTTDKEASLYIDENGRSWASVDKAAELIGKAESVVKRLIKENSIPSKPAFSGKTGQQIIIFDLEPISEAAKAEYGGKPEMDPKTGTYTDSEGVVWAARSWIAKKLERDIDTITRVITDNNIFPIKGIITAGRVVDLYPVNRVDALYHERYDGISIVSDERIYTDENSKKWATLKFLSRYFKKTEGVIRYFLKNHTVDSKDAVNTRGFNTIIFDFDDFSGTFNSRISEIEVDKSGIYTDGQGVRWASERKIANLFQIATSEVRNLNLESISGYANHKECLLLNLTKAYESLGEPKKELPAVNSETGIYHDESGERWATLFTISNIVSSDKNITKPLQSMPLRSIDGRDIKNIIRKLYNVDQALILYERRDSLPKVDLETGVYTSFKDGSRWASIRRIADILHPEGNIRPFLDSKKLEFIKGIDSSGRERDLFSLDQAEKIYKESFGSPKVDKETGVYIDPGNGSRWATLRTIAKILVGPEGNHTLFTYYKLNCIEGLDNNNHPQKLFSLDQAEQIFKEKHKTEIQTKDYTAVISSSQSKKIFFLLGMANHSDILHLLSDKEYEDVPDKEKLTILREYLGDSMLQRMPLRSLGDPEVINVFKKIDQLDQSIKDKMAFNLLETVIKNGIIDLYSEMAAGSHEEDVFYELVIEWFDRLKKEANSEFLNYVLGQSAADLRYIISYVKPDNIIDRLGENRTFPDFYQKINIAGIRKKKKLMIADEMGMGKSASAILAKETLRKEGKVRSALLVVPSNVIENNTWQDYLSAHSSENQKGYFVEGEQPRVLVVDSIKDLESGNIAGSYDYVIISHERLTKIYLDKLMSIDFDMLIVDESHKFKKIEGARSDNLLELSHKFSGDDKYLIMLSGTPVPNKVHDIAMTIKILRSDIPEIRDIGVRALARQIIDGSEDLARLAKIRGYFVSHMEMKRMTEVLVGHKKYETDVETGLSPEEEEIYEVILEDDDLNSSQKLQYLRQFLLNPQLFDPSIEVKCSKTEELQSKIDSLMTEGKKKIIVFVNGYIEGVIRGEKSIIDNLRISSETTVYSIHGNRQESDDRKIVQEKIKTSDEEMVVFVSGQTSDVGVDFSGADAVIEYNDPWSLYDKGQQIGRVYRPGLDKDIEITTFLTGELEKGIREYIKAKQKAIEKLLNGIPLSELEKRLVEKSEVVTESENIDLSNEQEARGLIDYLSSNSQILNRIFAASKEIGEKEFVEKIVNSEWGEKYAEAYLLCGSHAYQPNVNRLHATLIDQIVKKEGLKPEDLLILDLASGPEMLRRHIGKEYQGDQILSMDVNPKHFEEESGLWHVGGYSKLSESLENECDFINLSLAFHYAKFDERLNLLIEMNKALKIGGRAMISLPYSLELKEKEQFIKGLHWFGFEIDPDYSGAATSGNSFMIDLITLRKTGQPNGRITEIKEMLRELDLIDGFKLKRSKISLAKQDRIVEDVMLNDHDIKIEFNESDQHLLTEEQSLISMAESLKSIYGEIENIPSRLLLQTEEESDRPLFTRIKYAGKYVLFSKLSGENGYIILK